MGNISEEQVDNVVDNTSENIDGGENISEKPEYVPRTIKHLDEEIVIDSPEKEQEYLSKGADYDRKIEKLKELEDKLSRYEQKEKEAQIDNEFKQFMEDEGFEDEDRARKFFNAIREKETVSSKLNKIEETKQKEEMEIKQMSEFLDYYKDMTGEDIEAKSVPKQVFEIAEKEGKSYIDAYNAILVREKIKEEKVNKMNSENKNKAIDDVTKDKAGVETDELRVKGYTLKDVEKMSGRELSKTNLSTADVLKLMNG